MRDSRRLMQSSAIQQRTTHLGECCSRSHTSQISSSGPNALGCSCALAVQTVSCSRRLHHEAHLHPKRRRSKFEFIHCCQPEVSPESTWTRKGKRTSDSERDVCGARRMWSALQQSQWIAPNVLSPCGALQNFWRSFKSELVHGKWVHRPKLKHHEQLQRRPSRILFEHVSWVRQVFLSRLRATE